MNLSRLVSQVRAFYDPTREPLRRRVYTYVLGILAVAVTAGVLTGSVAAAAPGFLALVLAVPVVEKARNMVTPVADPLSTEDVPGKHAVDSR